MRAFSDPWVTFFEFPLENLHSLLCKLIWGRLVGGQSDVFNPICQQKQLKIFTKKTWSIVSDYHFQYPNCAKEVYRCSITTLDEAQEAGNASIHFEWESRYQVHFTQKLSCKIQQSHPWSGRPNSKGEEGQVRAGGSKISLIRQSRYYSLWLITHRSVQGCMNPFMSGRYMHRGA